MFGRGQGLNYGNVPKLLAPEISCGGNYVLDVNGQYYSTTKVYGYIKRQSCPYSYYFLLGLLNSSIFWFFIRNTGYVLRGGFFTFKTNYVSPFPIPEYKSSNIKLIRSVENLVKEILVKRENNHLCDVSILVKQIDDLVFQIYDFTKIDIETVLFL